MNGLLASTYFKHEVPITPYIVDIKCEDRYDLKTASLQAPYEISKMGLHGSTSMLNVPALNTSCVSSRTPHFVSAVAKTSMEPERAFFLIGSVDHDSS